MSKYAPLESYLKSNASDNLSMHFSDIENLLRFKLPKSSRTHRAWWSNNPNNNVMTRAWIDAGYETASVDLSAEWLVFKRIARKPGSGSASSSAQAGGINSAQAEAQPLFGSLKGWITINDPDAIMQPADPLWGETFEGKSS